MNNHKTAADLFNEVGPALYGIEWMEPLAEALGVKRSTLRNIRRGNMEIGPDHGIMKDLLRIAEQRARVSMRAQKARDAIRAWMSTPQ